MKFLEHTQQKAGQKDLTRLNHELKSLHVIQDWVQYLSFFWFSKSFNFNILHEKGSRVDNNLKILF